MDCLNQDTPPIDLALLRCHVSGPHSRPTTTARAAAWAPCRLRRSRLQRLLFRFRAFILLFLSHERRFALSLFFFLFFAAAGFSEALLRFITAVFLPPDGG